MNISMEQIDELRKRTNCSYAEAKALLEKHNGNILDAVVDFESTQTFHCSHFGEEGNFWSKVKALLRKGFQTRFIILNQEETIINLSINFMILVAILGFHLLIVGLVLALILGYKIRIRKDKSTVIDVDKIIIDATEKVKNTANSVTQETDEKNNKETKNDYNEVTVE